MSIDLLREEALDFERRIKQTFEIVEDQTLIVFHHRILLSWVYQEPENIAERAKTAATNDGLLSFLSFSKNQAVKGVDDIRKTLNIIREFLERRLIAKEFQPQQHQLPQQIIESINYLRGNEIPLYFGRLVGPFMENCYLPSKSKFSKCIQSVCINNLRCLIIDSELAHKYQRNLVQQIFGRVFRDEGSLSLVLKIEVDNHNAIGEKQTELYCYIEDLTCQENVQSATLEDITEEDNNLYLNIKGKFTTSKFKISTKSFLRTLLSEILIVPVQTLVSDYIVSIQDKEATLVKYHKGSREELTKLRKQHPSIRNPLFYYQQYLRGHQIKFSQIEQYLDRKQLIANFYQGLKFLTQLMLTDFTVTSSKIKISSLCFNQQIFLLIWQAFHRIMLLPDWIEQVIRPIKEFITLRQIIKKFCPIFNEISNIVKSSLKQYKQYVLNMEIQTYLTSSLNEVSIEIYKDMFFNTKHYDDETQYFERKQVYDQVFSVVFNDFIVTNYSIHQAFYFLNFIAEIRTDLYLAVTATDITNQQPTIPKSWKDSNLWRRIYELQQKQTLNYRTFFLDILGFRLGINTVSISNRPFENIAFQKQTKLFQTALSSFIRFLYVHHEEKAKQYLQLLLHHSFKSKKYKICKILINERVILSDFSEIFDLQEHNKLSLVCTKNKPSYLTDACQKFELLQLIRKREPEMLRRYNWSQFVSTVLKQASGSKIKLRAINHGQFYIAKDTYEHYLLGGILVNSISRKDYMACSNRTIGKINLEKQVYIEISKHPLLRYFYEIFLKKLGKQSLLLNFCGFLNDNGTLVHLIEQIPNCITFQKGCSQYLQQELKKLTNRNDLQQAILISILLMPTNVSLRNILFSTMKDQCRPLLVVDFIDYYQKYPFEKRGADSILKVKNCLFLFNQMFNSISINLMKKYSCINVVEFVQSVFTETAKLVHRVNSLKMQQKTSKNGHSEQKQLLTMIFQKQFAFTVAERMFKIKQIFIKKIASNKSICHMQLLNIISPQLSYYYQEIIESSHDLLERQHILNNDKWKKPFVHSETIINFFALPLKREVTMTNFPQDYNKLQYECATESLEHLYDELSKLKIYSEKMPCVASTLTDYFIRNADLSKYTKSQRQQLLQKMQEKSQEYLQKVKKSKPLSLIRLHKMQIPKEKALLFLYQRLEQLILEKVKSTDTEINALFKKLTHVSVITVSYLKGVTIIGQQSIYYTIPAQMRSLRWLSVVQCATITVIDLKCDVLENLTIRNNKSLEALYVKSHRLRTIDCSYSPRLKLENIGMYILHSVNVLIGKNSWDSDIIQNYATNYNMFLAVLLGQILHRFQTNEAKTIIITTLLKLGDIEESYFSYGGISLLNNNLFNLVVKLSYEHLRTIQGKIIELYFLNEHVTQFHVSRILSFPKDKFDIVTEMFEKKKTMKSYEEVVLGEMDGKWLENTTYLSLVRIFNAIKMKSQCKLKIFKENIGEEQKYLDLIYLLVNSRNDIKAVQLTFTSCRLAATLFEEIFSKNNPPKISILTIDKTQIFLEIYLKDSIQNVKQLILTNSTFEDLRFLANFSVLIALTIDNCHINSQSCFQQTVKRMKSLTQLSLLNIRTNKHTSIFKLNLLFKSLAQLDRLGYLNFSHNYFDANDLQVLNQGIKKLRIWELVLFDFYNTDIDYNFSLFLLGSNVKQLKIEFKDHKNHLKSFLESFTKNKQIINLHLETPNEIPSPIFQQLKKNSYLGNITSNQLLPNWLMGHIKNNASLRLSIIKEDIAIDQGSSYNQRLFGYHKFGLSLDGGGVRGLLLATELQYLTREVKRPLHQVFDCIGGTSIGGILTLGCTASYNGINPVCSSLQLMQIIQKYGKQIFNKKNTNIIRSVVKAKYDAEGLMNVLNRYFSNLKLSQVLKQTSVIVTAVNRIDNKAFLFRSSEAKLARDQDFYIKDVARATSAAPTFFPSAEIKNVTASQSFSLIDGGMGLNNPSKLVIDEIRKKASNSKCSDNYFLLSLGTGRLPIQSIPQDAGLRDLAPVIDTFSESANYFIEQDFFQNYQGHYLRVSPTINIPRKDGQMDNTEPEILQVYKQLGLKTAREYFDHAISFGQHRIHNLIDWLRENTARKFDP